MRHSAPSKNVDFPSNVPILIPISFPRKRCCRGVWGGDGREKKKESGVVTRGVDLGNLGELDNFSDDGEDGDGKSCRRCFQ